MLSESSVKLGTSRSVIRELFEFGKQRAAIVGAENVYDFSIGNPSVAPPAQVNETAIDILKNADPVAIHGYTSANGDILVRQQLAQSVNNRFSTSYTADNFYIATGAAGALCSAIKGLCCPNDEFVVFAPYFPEYKVFIEAMGGRMALVPADIDTFQINFDAFVSTLNENTKAVIINSPNNPSGAVYSKETIERLAAILTEKSNEYGHPIYLISDEPYREIAYGVEIPWVPDYYGCTIVCYSYSKSLSLPGERVGYVLVPDSCNEQEPVYAAVTGAARALGYVNAPSLFQRVCAQCSDMTADIGIYERNRNILLEGLRSFGYHCVEPGGTFYLFPRTLEADDVAFCERAKQFDLLIVPGVGFGCPGHTRISYCVPTERIERALPVFKKLAESYK
ncbi:MAG: pyridoxal phosphate-dependent aminotransferase [Ruminococcaceae bacterium]|nr:pyridoxal phosphate-dependent aminotransferase [Oscillospiraceae bacterium]